MTREDIDVAFFSTSSRLRDWFVQNHDSVRELWIGFYRKGSGKGGITYREALDEALCFGWIDGVRKRIDDISYTSRFTPRRPRSIWSAVNLQRFGELREQGVVHAAGLRAFEQRDEQRTQLYSYENRPETLDAEYEKRFRANPGAWEFFRAQPPFYRRTAIWWVMSAKREETRLRRLATLISDSEHHRRSASLTPTQGG